MTEAEAAQSLKSILNALKIERGDLVYLGTDMGGIPLPTYPADLTRDAIRERETKWCEFLYFDFFTLFWVVNYNIDFICLIY